MHELLYMTYFWLKAGHIIFVIFWMAGLFMLPRFFVYHQECEPDSPENAKWIEREAKLIKIILTPSIGVVWVLGLILAYHYRRLQRRAGSTPNSLLVLGLSGYQGWLTVLRQSPCPRRAQTRRPQTAHDQRSSRDCRGDHRRAGGYQTVLSAKSAASRHFSN